MYISKKNREIVRNKYGGKCAYTGTELLPDWQIDHIIPIKAYNKGYFSCNGNPNDITNLLPCQRIINHYKRGLPLEDFRNWYLKSLHERLIKLPKNPKVERSIKHKAYLLEVARLFNITSDKPFLGKFYFETLKH